MNARQPIHNGVDRIQRHDDRQYRTRHHDNGNAQLTRGDKLRRRRIAARILAHDNVDIFSTQKLPFIGNRERPTRGDNPRSQSCGRREIVDHPYQIIMLLGRDETPYLKPADGEKDAPGRYIKRPRRRVHIDHVDPFVSLLFFPACALEAQQGHSDGIGGGGGMSRHLRRERMRRIDQRREIAPLQKIAQTLNTAEAADTMGNGLRRNILRAPGKGEQRLKALVTGDMTRQRARLARAAKDQDFARHAV